MTTWRVRKLSTRGPGEAGSTGRGLFWAVSDQAGAVFDVDAHDREVSEEAIRAALVSGKLRSSDLVTYEGHWVPLLEAPPFLDEASRAHRREQRLHFAKNAGLALIALGALVAIAAVQMLSGR